MSAPNIKTKDCSYGCGKQIYWNVLQNAYYEANTQQKHICPNRRSSPSKPPYQNQKYGGSAYGGSRQTTTIPKEEKPEMSNTFEFIVGSPRWVREQYQYLSSLIQKANGKVHGSQSHIRRENNNELEILIYFEVPKTYLSNIQESFKQFLDSKKDSGSVIQK